ncbi:uncharacterized protein LOC133789280 isoform X2 [Humulus lupulus]|uniref:uncharacterized protein LOC133789280 isoform X2 n=1 Tax=Humulus lupulus TaxID=3486 RepID=UPI002B40B10F|nr:uncharacterized protein LOC133789280 isoform X2 [Humulus lupulus]
MAALQASYLSSFNSISPKKPTLFSSTNAGSKAHPFKPFKLTFSLNSANDESQSPQPISPNSPDTSSEPKPAPVDPVKLAFAKAMKYKKSTQSTPNLKIEQNPVKEFGSANDVTEKLPDSGLKENGANSSTGTVEKKAGEKGKLSVSSLDFVGLNFADKKTGRGLPAGLAPMSDPFPEGDIPEVEFIVGDSSKFTDANSSNPKAQGDKSDVYKPKVSSWGVFPRPSNISKTFGGGRVINPEEALETAEEKAAKDARTKELIAAYKRQFGLNIDAKLKAECEEALNDGDSLMNTGQLKEALPYYEKIMEKLPFKSELYGLAALQWSICEDSLGRRNEARVMYEKLQSHPTARVSKKARQFTFSFQAMEMMKFTTSSPYLKNTGYQNYFEAFVEKKSNYPIKEVEDETRVHVGPLLGKAHSRRRSFGSPVQLQLLGVVGKAPPAGEAQTKLLGGAKLLLQVVHHRLLF